MRRALPQRMAISASEAPAFAAVCVMKRLQLQQRALSCRVPRLLPSGLAAQHSHVCISEDGTTLAGMGLSCSTRKEPDALSRTVWAKGVCRGPSRTEEERGEFGGCCLSYFLSSARSSELRGNQPRM